MSLSESVVPGPSVDRSTASSSSSDGSPPQAVATRESDKPKCLILAYPCSLESTRLSGIEIGSLLCLPGHSDTLYPHYLPGPLITHRRDETDMASDFMKISHLYTSLSDVHFHKESQVIDKIGFERIPDIREVLTHTHGNKLTMLYIIGHGLNEKTARNVRETGKWKWELVSCMQRNGINKFSDDVKRDARRGDIVVFSSGFLPPQWIVDRLRERDYRGVKSTVVIIVDSCLSGVWKETISDSMPLEHTRVIVQTACGPGQESYGGIFSPSFYALQGATAEYIDQVKSIPYDDSEAVLQTPTFYDSDNLQNDDTPYAEVDVSGTKLRFFTDGKFFEKFCDKAFYDNARGIPDGDLRPFFESFTGEEANNILCYKLKHYSPPCPCRKPKASCQCKDRPDGQPMALVLVQWHPPGRDVLYYHLHLHFDRFCTCKRPHTCTRGCMNLMSVTHLRVIKPNRPLGKYKYYCAEDLLKNPNYPNKKELMDETLKAEILKGDMRIWSFFKSRLVQKCIDLVESVGEDNWYDRDCWRMSEAKPKNVIRSRTAVLQEVIGES